MTNIIDVTVLGIQIHNCVYTVCVKGWGGINKAQPAWMTEASIVFNMETQEVYVNNLTDAKTVSVTNPLYQMFKELNLCTYSVFLSRVGRK